MHAPSPTRCCTRAICSTRTAPTRERTSRAGSSECWARRAPLTPASARMTRCPRRFWSRSSGVPVALRRGAVPAVAAPAGRARRRRRPLRAGRRAGHRRPPAWLTWDEAVECEIPFGPFAVTSLPRTLADLGRRRAPTSRCVDGGRLMRTRRRSTVNSTSPPSATASCCGSAFEVRNVAPPAADKDVAIATSLIGTHLLIAKSSTENSCPCSNRRTPLPQRWRGAGSTAASRCSPDRPGRTRLCC